MEIKEILSQVRRDFTAIMKCEFCNHEEKDTSGYDDRNYHDNVIPDMKCTVCKKSTISEGGKIKYREIKYPEHKIV